MGLRGNEDMNLKLERGSISMSTSLASPSGLASPAFHLSQNLTWNPGTATLCLWEIHVRLSPLPKAWIQKAGEEKLLVGGQSTGALGALIVVF